MQFLAHLGFTLLILFSIRIILEKKTISRQETVIAAIGAFIPDLVDKTASQLFNASGRGIAHTLIFCGILSLVALYYNHEKGQILTIAIIIHLFIDLEGVVPLFWPLTPLPLTKPFFDTVLGNYLDPKNLLIELCGALALIIAAQLYKRQISFLKLNKQIPPSEVI